MLGYTRDMAGFTDEFADEIVAGLTVFRVSIAVFDDLPHLVELLRDDPLGSGRENDDLAPYESAFMAIDSDPNHLLAVVRDAQNTIAGTMQLTLLPGLARGGMTRLQIEAVRVAASHRGSGLGAAMFAWAHHQGRQHGATLAQLTTDKSRDDAHRFYERLGYRASHEGMKMDLT
jgi:GNAT superfamily N-acetyltransferase